jgi:hypothetical protein
MGTSTPQGPMGAHGLLQGCIYLFILIEPMNVNSSHFHEVTPCSLVDWLAHFPEGGGSLLV